MSQMAALAAEQDEQLRIDDPHGAANDPANYGEHAVATDVTTAGDGFTLDDVDADIIADLERLGVFPGTLLDGSTVVTHFADPDATKRESAAALFLRLAAEADAEVARIEATMLQQVEIVTTHYERLMERHARRRRQFVRFVESIARDAFVAGDFGKKKSAETPFGSFGVKHKSAALEMSDPAALLAHLADVQPEYVRVVAKLPLAEAKEFLSPSELAATKHEVVWGEYKKAITQYDANAALPPGVTRTPATDVPFAKPELPFTSVFTGVAR